MKWPVIVSGIILVILLIVNIIVGLFSMWTFIGLLFYLVLYVFGFVYIKNGLLNQIKTEDEFYRTKQRFDWCWERVNTILKAMPGGQGLQWASGIGRKSIYKTFYDGIQNKPFRSILAHFEYAQQLVLILYDIDSDDIAAFITNPGPDLIDNPFLNFKPYARGVDNRDPRLGGMMGGRDPYSRRQSPRGGVNIQVGGDDGFDDFAPRRQPPSGATVDKAMDALDRK